MIFRYVIQSKPDNFLGRFVTYSKIDKKQSDGKWQMNILKYSSQSSSKISLRNFYRYFTGVSHKDELNYGLIVSTPVKEVQSITVLERRSVSSLEPSRMITSLWNNADNNQIVFLVIDNLDTDSHKVIYEVKESGSAKHYEQRNKRRAWHLMSMLLYEVRLIILASKK